MIGIGAAGAFALEVGGLVFNQGIGTLVGFPLLLLVGSLVGRNRASYRVQAEQSAALLAQHEQLRAEQRRADVLDERARIAREIHDVLAHSLGALSIQIQTARALFTDLDDPDRGLEALATAQRMAADGLTETRRAVLALRKDTLPLPAELARAAAEHAEVHRVTVHCDTDGGQRSVPPDVTVALLRTARESLVNAAKHAPGQSIDVRLGYAGDRVRMTIANALADGVAASGAPPAPALRTVDGGYGLTGMHERLRLLRGTLDAGIRGGEWIVTAELPLEASQSSNLRPLRCRPRRDPTDELRPRQAAAHRRRRRSGQRPRGAGAAARCAARHRGGGRGGGRTAGASTSSPSIA